MTLLSLEQQVKSTLGSDYCSETEGCDVGYTGLYTAEHIAAHLPTDLKWAIAGRSREKLEKIAADIKELNPDRRAVCSLRPSSREFHGQTC
jgi:hypothetical protein